MCALWTSNKGYCILYTLYLHNTITPASKSKKLVEKSKPKGSPCHARYSNILYVDASHTPYKCAKTAVYIPYKLAFYYG